MVTQAVASKRRFLVVIMLFVIFVPRGIAGLVAARQERRLRADAVAPPTGDAGGERKAG